MLKRDITYENPNEEMVTNTFYFNLSRHEIVEMELDHTGGLAEALERMIKAQDLKSIMLEMKTIVLSSYGVKSEDGKRFMKNEDLRTAFIETGAYDSLFMELVTDEEAATKFITGIIPKGFIEALGKSENVVTTLPSIAPQTTPPYSLPPETN